MNNTTFSVFIENIENTFSTNSYLACYIPTSKWFVTTNKFNTDQGLWSVRARENNFCFIVFSFLPNKETAEAIVGYAQQTEILYI